VQEYLAHNTVKVPTVPGERVCHVTNWTGTMYHVVNSSYLAASNFMSDLGMKVFFSIMKSMLRHTIL